MRLNQVTVSADDLDAAWAFYNTLGLPPIVDSRPRYIRFMCPEGDSTFSVEQAEHTGRGTTVYFETENLDSRVSQLKAAGLVFTCDPVDHPWLWREAELFDPAGNRILLYFAGENRINPPWRLKR